MQFFFNRVSAVVADMLDGVGHLAPVQRLEAEGIAIVARADWDKRRVAVISGGGSGHEPAHAGLVGEGMLTAAVCGELFASPSVEAVLAAIRHVTGEAGCVLIVKNYTGDRLNFGLAAERARQEGLRVATVLVADDVALPDAAQPRGLAGTVLVHKLAGYWAAQGAGLDEVAERAQTFAASLSTLGLALSSCTLPGQSAQARSPELGLGIHNEPGAQQVEPGSAAEAMAMVLEPLRRAAERHVGAAQRHVVLLNDLGGCSAQELLVLVRELCTRFGVERMARLIGPARLMSSLDMQGFSVTLAPADEHVLRALDAPVTVPAWPGVSTPHAVQRIALQAASHAPLVQKEQDPRLVLRLEAACAALLDAEAELNRLDAASGDGDTGSTFATAARAVLQRLRAQHLSTREPAELCAELGGLLAQVMGGSSGVLLSIFFTAAGVALRGNGDTVAALTAGVERLQHHGGAGLGDRTLLDALIPALRAQPGSVHAAAAAARSGADGTASMLHARAGRASYVPGHALRGVVDPGAEAVARVLQAWAGVP